ncbi:MAG: biotin transporter BioY [Candidatus Thermoplasmatota archaeon]|nr:biotin transporter BioY [Candidatus Thermoplasmatota archaeon]
MNINITGFQEKVNRYHAWRNELDLVYKVLIALGFAALTGLLAQARIGLPFTPVPVTGQTFAVLLAGIMLGRLGALSMGMYVGLGAAGIPWFTNMQGGIGYLTGATGGYLFGFILAAGFIGYMTERYVSTGKIGHLVPILLVANFLIIYLPGLLVLHTWWSSFVGPMGLLQLLSVGLLPFMVGDLMKIALVAGIAKISLPSVQYQD